MFHRLLTEIRPSEGTLVIYNHESKKFEMCYEYFAGDAMLAFGDETVREKIIGWFLDIDEFFDVITETDTIDEYTIYWMEA